jgi:hypothetical protein
VTPEERSIWQAAYAAAFVVEFARTQRSAELVPAHQRSGELPSDLAARVTNAEHPAWIADLTVLRLREWRRNEDPDMGVRIDTGDPDAG